MRVLRPVATCRGSGKYGAKRAAPGLWANLDFLSLWAGQTISLLGDQGSLLGDELRVS